MPTKGNTGQSSDSLDVYGKKQGWYDTDYDLPTSTSMEANKGTRGFGNNNLGKLGEPSKKWARCSEGSTPSPGDLGGMIPSVSSRGNVGAGKWRSGGESDKPNNDWRDVLEGPQAPYSVGVGSSAGGNGKGKVRFGGP